MQENDEITPINVMNAQAPDENAPASGSRINGKETPMSASRKKDKSKTITIIIPILLLVASSITSFMIFKGSQKSAPIIQEEEVIAIDEDGLLNISGLPKDKICPLNGALFTAPEEESWSQRRPLAVMIENSVDARPQSGLNNADIVFELVAEGGITRFMAMYYCNAQAEDIVLAPIRSARTYYINLASGFNLPMYAHVGGANVEGPTNALGQLADYGWNQENDINQFSVGYPTFVRDYNRIPGKEVATEHTMTTSTEKLWAVAEKRGWTNITPERTVGKTTIPAAEWSEGYKGLTFAQGESKGNVSDIAYNFWSGMTQFDVSWKYDATTNVYTRSNGGTAQIDLNTDEPLSFSNIIVMQAKETGPLNDEKHMMYEVIGSGSAYVFNNGEVTQVDWSKKTRESELEFTVKGEPYVFTAGPLWISVVDTSVSPSYK